MDSDDSDLNHFNFFCKKLKDVLSNENYGYSSAVVTYCETKGLIYSYGGMSEFRDALTHVYRALQTTNEDEISDELNSCYEHIRRAAVESIQEYVETKYYKVRRVTESRGLKVLFSSILTFKKIDWKNVKISENSIREKILMGREAKPRKAWQEAIGYFKQAETEIEELEAKLPTIQEINSRYNAVTLIAIIILSVYIGFVLR